jgi:hypothetical protein
VSDSRSRFRASDGGTRPPPGSVPEETCAPARVQRAIFENLVGAMKRAALIKRTPAARLAGRSCEFSNPFAYFVELVGDMNFHRVHADPY